MTSYAELILALRSVGAMEVRGFDLSHLDNSLEWSAHLKRFHEWLDSKREGQMQYLRKRAFERADPRRWYPGAKSVVCCAFPYPAVPTNSHEPRFANYLSSSDYHVNLRAQIEKALQELGLEANQYRIAVDTSPILERSLAALAGVGWIGKNTMLIHPKFGSHFFLAEVFFTNEWGVSPNPIPNYCGHCERCLKGCPTAALDAQGLNAQRCISYDTLENRSESIATELERERLGTWIAGCDVCQTVCPFNQKRIRQAACAEDTIRMNWDDVLKLHPKNFRSFAKGSALERVKPYMWDRNRARAFLNWLETTSGKKDVSRYVADVEVALQESDGEAKAFWREAYLRLQEEENLNP